MLDLACFLPGHLLRKCGPTLCHLGDLNDGAGILGGSAVNSDRFTNQRKGLETLLVRKTAPLNGTIECLIKWVSLYAKNLNRQFKGISAVGF
jgi:hypothetical protein